jgi:anti-sigma B factor antagonist
VLFSIDVSEHGGCTILTVEGEIDVATAPQLRQAAVRLANDGKTSLVIDLSGVGFLDSTGLGVIVGVVKRVRTQGGELAIAGADNHVRKVFEITRISDVLPMFDTVDEACAAVQSSVESG